MSRSAPRPIVALLTDFGTRDHYVGTMKGVVLGICPDAALVDLTHDIPPQDIRAAALELAAAWRFFPPGTIFLVVVDPGVGSSRRALAAEAAGYLFVAPDNGVLGAVLQDPSEATVVELSDPQYALPAVSRTFEGRDRFAPAAAWLARGTPITALGPRVTGWRLLEVSRPRVEHGAIHGVVERIDRFGNLITNIDRATFLQAGGRATAVVHVGSERIAGLVDTYAEAGAGALCALFGSADRLEIAARGGSAAERLGAARDTPVRVDVS